MPYHQMQASRSTPRASKGTYNPKNPQLKGKKRKFDKKNVFREEAEMTNQSVIHRQHMEILQKQIEDIMTQFGNMGGPKVRHHQTTPRLWMKIMWLERRRRLGVNQLWRRKMDLLRKIAHRLGLSTNL
jgi:hypothetical protein